MERIVLKPAELAREGHDLVQQDEARRRVAKYRDEPFRARTRAGRLRACDALHRIPSTETPREIAPEGAHLAASLDVHRLGRALVGADEHRAAHRAEGRDACFLKERRQARERFRPMARFGRAADVVEREHRVRFAAAEIRL